MEHGPCHYRTLSIDLVRDRLTHSLKTQRNFQREGAQAAALFSERRPSERQATLKIPLNF